MPHRDDIESVLGEYAADHPSITLSDISSPSNYTYYPWTLPPQFVSWNATSSVLPTRPTLDISFPAVPTPGSTAPPLQRVKDGILINVIGGLRLGMVQDTPWLFDDGFHDTWRVQTINNIPLGKDEKVYLGRATAKDVLSPADPNFTRVKDQVMLDLVVDLDELFKDPSSTDEQVKAPQSNAQVGPSFSIDIPHLKDGATDNAMKAAWNALVNQISSLIKDSRPQATWPFSTPLSLTVPTKRASASSGTASSSTAKPDSNVIPRYPPISSNPDRSRRSSLT